MRKWMIRVAVLAAIVLVVLLARFTIFRPRPVAVEVTTVQRGQVEETVTNSRAGTVRVRRRAKLSPEIGGQVAGLPFREGERVATGQVVLRLDDRSYRARLDLARSEQEAAAAEEQRACLAAQRARREAQRVGRLAAESIVSEDLLDQAESASEVADAACSTAQANHARARAAVQLARTELDKTVLRAPFDGVVAELSIELGEWTTPSPPVMPVPPVVDILDPSSLYISAPMDEVDSARIRAGLPVRVSVDSHRGRTFPGRVARVAPYVLDVQEQNRTVEIEVDLEPEERPEAFLPGTSADVEVILTVREEVLRVPTSSLIEGNRVLLLEGGVLAEREVVTGVRNWDYTEIVDGLSGGEQVVTTLDRPEVVAGAAASAEESP